MVPKSQSNCDSFSPSSDNVLQCLVCLQTIRYNESKYVLEISEILSDLFEVLCKYMEWSPPLRYEFNFNSDVFPFCKECRSKLVTLYKSHQLLSDVQKQINSVISNLCGKVLLSQNNKKPLEIGNSQNDNLSEEILGKREEKITYYRNLIYRRFSASVRVSTFAAPLSVLSPKIANHEQDEFGAEENWTAEEDEKVEVESLGIVQSDGTEIFEASMYNEETKENEITGNAEVPSSTIAIHEIVDFGASEKWVLVDEIANFEILQVMECNDTETIEASQFTQETQENTISENAEVPPSTMAIHKRADFGALEKCVLVNEIADFEIAEVVEIDNAETTETSLTPEEIMEDETDNVKRTIKRSEISELLILNHRRNPKRNFEKKHDQENIQSSDDEEFSSNDGQTEESDYEPSIASWENESPDDDDNLQEVTEPSVDGTKVHAEFEPGRSKFHDQVRHVGNDKYLFYEKYDFERNSENKWVCSSCNHQFLRKSSLLDHLAKICKGVLPTMRTKAIRATKEQEPDSTDGMEEDVDSSHYEIIQEPPQPKSVREEPRMLPLILRRSRLRKQLLKNTDVPDTKEAEGLAKTEDLSEQHIDSLVVLKSYDQIEARENGSTHSSAALELEEGTIKVASNVTTTPGLNPLYQDTKAEGCVSEDTDEDDTDEDEICAESDIFQKAELENRIQKIGPTQFLIDHRLSFEFVNNKWRCIPCELEYSSKEDLRAHFDKCPGNPPADSIETFKFKKYTYDKLKNGNFQCRHCKHISSSKDGVIVHLQGYPIQESGKKKLVVTNTTPDKFICNEKFSFEKVDDEYKCCECIYTAVRLTTMKIHMREKHVFPKNFECKVCGKICFTKQHLALHEKIHEVGPTLVCEICGKTLKTEQGLKKHKDNFHLDSSEKKFSCKICGKGFRIQALLNVHNKIHEHAMCDVCGKEIPIRIFKEHVASHSNIKLHECKKCGKRYQHYSALRVHLKNHDGVKPYSCDICDMKFTQQYSVTRHKNIAHNPNKPTKTIAKSRKRKRKEISSEEEETDEENTDDEELLEDEDSEEENDSSEGAPEEEVV